MPLAIAFYTPADFGMFAVSLFCANLVGSYGGLKLEWAVINEHSKSVADLLLRFSLTLLVTWGLVAFFLALAVPTDFYTDLKLERSAALLAAPVCVVIGFGLFLQSWGIRTKEYRQVFLSRNTVMVSRQMIQIGLGIIWPSFFALLISELVSRCIGVQIMLTKLGMRLRLISPTRFARLFGFLPFSRYGHYAKIALPSSLMDFLMTEGLAVMIVPIYGLDVAGAYWLVQRVFGLPIALIGTVAADILQGQVARCRSNKAALKQMIEVGILLTCFSLIVLPAAALAFWLFTQFLYAGKWMLSGQLALYLFPVVCTQFIASPISRILIVSEKMQYKYIFDGVMFLGLTSWLLLTKAGSLSLFQSIGYLSAAQTFAYCVYILICFQVVRKS
jgi:hypothetical protein